MSRAVMLVVLAATPALAQVAAVGDIVVVGDPTGAITGLVTNMGAILPSPQEQFCRAAFNAARAILPDDYDGVISFTTSEALTDLNNVWQGPPVRCAASGIGRADAPWMNTYNSTRLGQCVFMGTLGRTAGFIPGTPGSEALPADPDADWSPSLGIPLPGFSSLTGIEMLGHEYGHHWLLGIEHDLADGRGKQHYIRATTDQNPEGGQAGSPNQHYSDNADSRSVMYGECITEVDAGTYHLAGCARKYSHIDQYLMGLRAPNEVTPMMVLEDSALSGQGVDSLPMSRTSTGRTVTGVVRHDIGADAVIRAMGVRAPAYPAAKSCWKVAFIVVLAPGQTTVPTAMMQKVERYRQRWGPWFGFATDGRGMMETRLNVACPVAPDGGVDAGVPDAGEPDAGEDAGTPDAGEPDAGEDAGTDGGIVEDPPDAGPSKWDTYVNNDTGKIRPGCGCTSGEGMMALLAVLAAWRLRRR